jgi:formylglycine-generating enzyme
MLILVKTLVTALFAFSALSSFGQLVVADNCNVTGSGTGFALNTGVNTQLSARLSGIATNGLSYLQTATTKAASSYSINNNKIKVAVAANAGRFTFTTDRATPKDFGPTLGSDTATSTDPAIYDLSAKISNASSGTERTSFGVATADSGVQDWSLGIQLVNSGANLALYRRVDASCNPTGADYNNVIATLPGQAGAEISLRIRITDAGAETGSSYSSKYEVYANGALVFASSVGDFRFSSSPTRVVLFDTAPSAGPVTYDDFSMSVVTATNTPPHTTNDVIQLASLLTPQGFVVAWGSNIGTNYTVLKSTNPASATWALATNVTATNTNTLIIVDGNVQSPAAYFRIAHLAQSGLAAANVSATQTAPGTVKISYNLSDLYSGTASVSVLVSTDGGLTYSAPAANFSGDVGIGIAPGTNHNITWNVGADWASVNSSNVRIKIVVDRAPISADMAIVPGGSFNMGDAQAEGLSCEVPVHPVNVSDFYMERHEVTKALWDDVVQWGTNHGYSFDNPGVAAQPSYPIQQVSWYDAVKWCNARSEKEGFAPAYFTDSTWTTVYRTGQVNLSEAHVRWQGAGYRLPTEAEWEKAARGGLSGKRFPFGDTIKQSQANYWSTDFEAYDVNGAPGPHPSAPDFPNVLSVGHFLPTGYGLYDMAGNSWEWCWDYYGDAWYSDARASRDDTRGPTSASWGGDRVYRGGSGVDIAWKTRIANRADAPPRFAMGHFGFRVVLPAGENLVSAESAVLTLTP